MPNASSLEAPSRSSVYTGILPSQKIREMVATRDIKSLEFSEISADQVQPASIDLRLGDFAYRMDASFLPGKGKKVWERMRELDPDFQSYGLDLRKGAVLERGRLYIIPLQESIRLRSGVSAFANPKSSTGRLDILTRLIADEATLFDQVEEGYEGQLYLEVAPRSFSVVVKTGTRLNQLRFRRTRGAEPKPISSSEWRQLLEERQVANTNGVADKT